MTAAAIFILEDEIITARSIAKNLRNLGYKVAGMATNGTKAIAEVLKLKPDLILIDISLKNSELDGISVAENIRSQMDVPVVYLTAHSDNVTLERAKTTIPSGYIVKPFTQKDLQITLKMALYKHRQESELIAREKLFANILNSTQDSIVATDKIAQVTFMNPAAQQLTGWQTAEALKQDVSEVVNIIDARTNCSISHPVEQAIAQGKPVYLDEHMVLVAKNGSRIPIADSASPMEQADRVEGAVLIFSQKRETETTPTDAIATISTSLGRLRTDLLEFIVHELRTPLTIILSTSESLRYYRQRWTENKQNQSFDKIQRAVEQMNRLLDNVSVWEQADSNLLFPHPESVDLVLFCQELLADFRSLDGDRHQLVFTALVNDATAELDPTLLRYALSNLLSNAIKYSPPDSTIYLALEKLQDSFVLQIRDRGRGIPLLEQPYLFDSFYRASNVGNVSGTGLGLAIAKKCIEIQQGAIAFKSELGKGTTFTVTLPAL